MVGVNNYKNKLPELAGRIKRLAARHPVVAIEVVIKPIPVLHPAVAVPVDVGHVLGVVGVTLKIMRQPSIPLPLEYSWS